MSDNNLERDSAASAGAEERPRRDYLSIDVEDIVVAAAELHRTHVPADYQENLEHDLRRTLDTLAECGAHATFFVNGRYCKRYDTLMREIVARGHRLATHGHHHYDVRELSLSEFSDDLKNSIDVLTKYQDKILGYRPPAFTMPFDAPHLQVLLDNGLKYVSCGALFERVNVPHHDVPVRLDCGLLYIPVSMAYFGHRLVRYPVGYGHVSRILPQPFVLAAMRHWIRRVSYFQFYFHPYELGGLLPRQRRSLISVNRKDIPQRIYSLRCRNRSRLFARIFNTCRFQPLESMEALSNGQQLESRIG